MYIKPSFFVRLIALCGVVWLGGRLALAQTTPLMGVLVPATTSVPAPKRPHHAHKDHAHKDHAHQGHRGHHGHRHKKGNKGPLLPVYDQFKSLSVAIAHCPPGMVEWASMGRSVSYHDKTSRYFGHTKHGVYACKAALEAAGFRAGR